MKVRRKRRTETHEEVSLKPILAWLDAYSVRVCRRHRFSFSATTDTGMLLQGKEKHPSCTRGIIIKALAQANLIVKGGWRLNSSVEQHRSFLFRGCGVHIINSDLLYPSGIQVGLHN